MESGIGDTVLLSVHLNNVFVGFVLVESFSQEEVTMLMKVCAFFKSSF